MMCRQNDFGSRGKHKLSCQNVYFNTIYNEYDVAIIPKRYLFFWHSN